MIKAGQKTETRRKSGIYKVGRTYSIQPGRTQAGIAEGRILMTKVRIEKQPIMISFSDAKAEGEYIPEKFEELYLKMHPYWKTRYAYTFRYIPIEKYRQKGLF